MNKLKILIISFTAFLACTISSSQATTYYIDSSDLGKDINNGTSSSTPWKTLSKAGSVSLKPGDSVLLRCGQSWQEQLTIHHSGSAIAPITIGRYGSNCVSTPPTILGVDFLLGGWLRLPGDKPIYYKDNIKKPIYQLLIKNSPNVDFQWLSYAQFPNPGYDSQQPTNQYLSLATMGSTVGYIETKNEMQLPQGADLNEANVHLRIKDWLIQDRKVKSYSPDTGIITFDFPTMYSPTQGYGYFFDGKLWMLDKEGEWFYDPAPIRNSLGNLLKDASGKVVVSRLYVWLPDGKTPGDVQMAGSVRTSGIDTLGNSYITFDGLKIIGAVTGINAKKRSDHYSSTGITIKNCQFEFSGSVNSYPDPGWSDKPSKDLEGNIVLAEYDSAGTPAINLREATASTVVGNKITKSVYIAINAFNANGVLVSNNFIRSTGDVGSPRRSTGAILADNYKNINLKNPFAIDHIRNNVIENSGYVGIRYGREMIVSGNSIKDSCLVLDDCSAMIDFNVVTPDVSMNTILRNNFIDGVIGNPNGRVSGAPTLAGIYLDDYSNGVTVDNNFVQNSLGGILLHNSFNNKVTNNTLYHIFNQGVWITENNIPGQSLLVKNNQVAGNLFALDKNVALTNFKSSFRSDTSSFSDFSHNRYSGLYEFPFFKELDFSQATIFQSVGMATYITVLSGSDLLKNGNFENGLAGDWHEYASDGLINLIPINNCATGGKCIRMVTSDTQGATYALISGSFRINKGTTYRLKFDIKSDRAGKAIKVEVINGSMPYQNLGFINEDIIVDPSWRHYEIFFTGIETRSTGNLIVSLYDDLDREIELDNIRLEPATQVPGDTSDDTVAITNSSPNQLFKHCPFTGKCAHYVELETGLNVSWPLMMQPYSSKILVWKNDPLIDSDVDGIIDSLDLCPLTGRRYGVMDNGCPI
ncbi:MAG: right-handed parallel beta-helix repeat-containing protein [Pseudomonadota bacterium]